MESQQLSMRAYLLSAINHTSPTMLGLILACSLMSLAILLLLFNLIRNDYQAAVARGSGGTPSSFLGYLEINFFRLFRKCNSQAVPEVPSDLWMQRGYLENLPIRNGVRPRIVGLAPQRQTTQVGSKAMYEALANIIVDFARTNQSQCYLGRSTFKNNNTALFARTAGFTQTKYHGEICHAHPDDGSMHLNMHPADVKVVVEAGWGELHPLARPNYWWNLICPVPAGLTMVYSPRDEKELEVMKIILRAAAWWMSGVDSKSVQDSWS